MNCNVIRDLLPLYVDGCCSEDSAELVREHLQHCKLCERMKGEMQASPEGECIRLPRRSPMGRIQLWRASLLQAVLQLVSFGALIVAVALEAATAAGSRNGFWAVLLLVPFTAFLLAQSNWYFIRCYGSRMAFCIGSTLVCLGFSILGYGWALLHYGTACFGWNMIAGGVLTAVLSVVSFGTSAAYAVMLGKE